MVDGVGAVEGDGDGPDRGLEPMRARADPPEVGQGHRHADRPVAAHAEVADVVEEDDAGRGGRIDRLEDQGADHHVRAARLVDDRRPERVVPVAEHGEAIGHRAGAQLGACPR